MTNQHQNGKHKEILKGANEEGNEGRQVGKWTNKQDGWGQDKLTWEHMAHKN